MQSGPISVIGPSQAAINHLQDPIKRISKPDAPPSLECTPPRVWGHPDGAFFLGTPQVTLPPVRPISNPPIWIY